jgi:hypothetical protein
MLTTTVPLEPSSGVQNKVSSQSFDSDKVVSELLVVDMPVVSLTCLVVVTNDADVVDNQSQPIFEIVQAASNRGGHPPNHDLGAHIFDKRKLGPYDLDSINHITSPKVM